MEDNKEQKLTLSNREYLELTGVTEVINFTEDAILLESNLGNLTISGENLHVKHLDLENSQLVVTGYVTELKYNQEGKAENFIKRLFK
ncbi:sporulation protein YabP [Orenia metallireducens]|uniref:Sporulation protein YabP n=1 Tax=Orenia metallireducens TaxID=1413210 RepID=A0A285H0A9_9FIRM|nr:sporulation protein YabP [Orenia metallireducens]PRX21815.1 sporulation protein YabP [Orenia metallireducens]SNY29185.1 sporulation protein YabP [Orenia metallireducens]